MGRQPRLSGDGEIKVRPLPPPDHDGDDDDRGVRRRAVAAGVAIAVLVAIGGFVWLGRGDTGEPGPGASPSVPAVAEPALPTVPATTLPPPTTVAPPATTPAVPAPPQAGSNAPAAWPGTPFTTYTALGAMTWTEVELPGAGTATRSAGIVRTATGFATLLVGEDGTQLLTSPDGRTWSADAAPLDLDLEEAWSASLVASGEGVFVVGSTDRQAWAWERSAAGWREVTIERTSTEWPRWLEVATVVQGAWGQQGLTLVASTWIGGVDHVRVLGLTDDDLSEPLPGGGVRVRQGEDGEPRTYDVTLTGAGQVLSVTVTDAATGEAVFAASDELPGAGAAEVAATITEQGGYYEALATSAWSGDPDTGLVAHPLPTGASAVYPLSLAATDAGVVVAGTGPAAAGATPIAWFSPDGRSWVDVTDAIPFGERPAVLSASTLGGRFALHGTEVATVQITEKVTGRAPAPTTWVSADGLTWARAAAAPSSTALPDVLRQFGRVEAGPLGYATVGQNCRATCTVEVWLSVDGVSWEGVGLGPAQRTGGYFSAEGLAVGEDQIVVLMAVWPGNGPLSGHRAWVATRW